MGHHHRVGARQTSLFWLLLTGAVCTATPSFVHAFPDTPVLDTFTGTDGISPPNSNWTNAQLMSSSSGCDRQDNAAAPSTTGGYWSCYWNSGTVGPDLEVYGTIANLGSTGFVLVCGRLNAIGNDTTTGYCVEETDGPGGSIVLLRIDLEARVQIASVAQSIDAIGDKIGLKIVGNTICAWFAENGGSWNEVVCATDATYGTAGHIGIILNGTAGVGGLDDFGGGTVSSLGQMRKRLM